MNDWDSVIGQLGDIPVLPGARCRHRWELFDATIHAERGDVGVERRDHARAAATKLCHQCPALDACRTWLDALPTNDRPLGVVAGQLTN